MTVTANLSTLLSKQPDRDYHLNGNNKRLNSVRLCPKVTVIRCCFVALYRPKRVTVTHDDIMILSCQQRVTVTFLTLSGDQVMLQSEHGCACSRGDADFVVDMADVVVYSAL